MSNNSDSRTVMITHAQEIFLSWSLDILIYTIVLNFFVEHHKGIIIDSFSISVLTAILLTVLLHAIMRFEHLIHHYFGRKEGKRFKVLGFLATWSILFLSKFAILEIVNLIFGDHVELGHFIDLILLILAMLIARQLGSWFYRRLDDDKK